MKRERYALPESALDIGMPDRRAKRCTPPRAATPPKPSAYSASQAEREQWMRTRQAKKRQTDKSRMIAQANAQPTRQQRKEQDEAEHVAVIEGQRERQLLMEAEGELMRRVLRLRGTVNKEGPDTTEKGRD